MNLLSFGAHFIHVAYFPKLILGKQLLEIEYEKTNMEEFEYNGYKVSIIISDI